MTGAITRSAPYLNDGDKDNSRSGDSDKDGDNNKDVDHDSYSDYKTNNNSSYHDGDDNNVIVFGHVASAAESRQITAVVKRYYAAAAMGDGRLACRLMNPILVKAIPEDYGRAPGPAYARGKTCSVVLSKSFKHLSVHPADLTAIEVTDVHVDGNEAHALLGSKRIPASFVILQRYGGVWKIDVLLGRTLS